MPEKGRGAPGICEGRREKGEGRQKKLGNTALDQYTNTAITTKNNNSICNNNNDNNNENNNHDDNNAKSNDNNNDIYDE